MPSHPTGSGLLETALRLQWRDRAGLAPASSHLSLLVAPVYIAPSLCCSGWGERRLAPAVSGPLREGGPCGAKRRASRSRPALSVLPEARVPSTRRPRRFVRSSVAPSAPTTASGHKAITHSSTRGAIAPATDQPARWPKESSTAASAATGGAESSRPTPAARNAASPLSSCEGALMLAFIDYGL